MPALDFAEEAVWNSLYSCEIGGRICHFERAAKDAYFGRDHYALRDALGVRSGQSVVLIGAAFGWVAEDWIDAGCNVTAVDTSPWIHARKTIEARIPILNADCTTAVGRAAIVAAAGATIDWIISEDVMPVLSDAACIQLATSMRLLSINVAHWVSCVTASTDRELNRKTLAQWKALVPLDRVVRRGTNQVM